MNTIKYHFWMWVGRQKLLPFKWRAWAMLYAVAAVERKYLGKEIK